MKKLFYLFISLLLLSCKKENTEPVNLSAYYWKTNFSLNEVEKSFVKEHQIKKLYTRYFDVGIRSNQAVPISPISFKGEDYLNQEIIPVIYIQNEVFKHKGVNEIKLAQKTFDYINQINKKHKITISEIQVDCDWSLKTKEPYFAFLEELKKVSKLSLSSTIRLHQVKFYEKTGIPPVDKGVLMYYNMGELAMLNENSIYNSVTANKYIKHLKTYPLYVDVAIPIFSWGVHSRNRKIVNVVGGMRQKDVEEIQNAKKIEGSNYKITKETIYKGRVFLQGDVIKIEEVSEENLKTIAKEIKENYNIKPKNIILYDLQESNIKNYEKQTFKKLSKSF